jgi:hypothetical protein
MWVLQGEHWQFFGTLTFTECLRGEDAYETSKFAEGLSHLTLSDGLQRRLRVHPVMGERRLAQRNARTPTARKVNDQL